MLAQATQDAARMRQPQGVGLDSPVVRQRMVARLTGLASEPVLRALSQVPRHRFVDPALAPQAYEDTALPIGHGQTISKPSVVARMLQLLSEGHTARGQGHLGRVLEIGTGCGYQAAVLCALSRALVSVERIAGLHVQSSERLRAWQREHHPRLPLQLLHDDGSRTGLAIGPFDSIIAAAGGEHLPQAWLDWLAPGGRLVAPVSEEGAQALLVVDHETNQGRTFYRRQRLEAVAFVPLRSGLE
ncbi:MAG: protein-L-isoaspartate O-methyltransferase [Burkholderiales bacterium]|nr:protein-L-isoaspartate O-methyltransferase [Burkholderiales bacterium]